MNDRAERWLAVPVPLPKPGVLRPFEVAGRRFVLCNADGAAYVLEDSCPHTGVALSPGRLTGCVLECPFHGGKLDVRDGTPVAPPIRRRARTFPVRAAGDRLEVDLSAGS
jgi:nitrite reductase/ring-hydroxylating ferredoxin subunit